MRSFSFLVLLCLLSCSHAELSRAPASVDTDYFYADVDHKKSLVKLFPPELINGTYHHYFYLELKNNLGQYVDCDVRDIKLVQKKGEKSDFRLERTLRGRYYVIIEGSPNLKQAQLNFLVSGKALKESFVLVHAQPDLRRSSIKILDRGRNRIRFGLSLGDVNGRAVELPALPEVMVDGNGEIENLEHTGEGTWEFDLIFPPDNQIIYLSVRAHGVLLEQLYRLQHIEQ